MMRSLSFGAILYVFLIVTVIFCGPMSHSAVAQPGIVVGFVVDEQSLVRSSDIGMQLSEYLHEQLSIPVKMRSFAAEDQLYNWLTNYREVDVAWLSREFMQKVPSGQLYSLAQSHDSSATSRQGDIVSRQGINATLRQQIREALISMNQAVAGHDVLAQLGINRFVPPPLWQTSDWDTVVEQSEEHRQAGESKQEARFSSLQAKTDSPEPSVPAKIEKEATSEEIASSTSQDVISEVEDPPQKDVAVVAAEKASDIESRSEQLSQSVVSQDDEVVEVDTYETPIKGSVETLVSDNQQEQIELVADYLAYNAAEDSYEAKGDVILRHAGVELKSEELLWQSATQDASAIGRISLEDAGTQVSGEQLQYNMSTGQGQVQQGTVFVREGNFRLAGDEIEKHGHADYFIRNGSFTTCDGEIPDWKFSAEEVEVTLGRYATARNVFFHIKDVPVLYTPYLFFPVKTERESGLLSPWVGYSNNKGARLSMAWYQVIDRNMDATFYLDYLSKLALGKGLEYRYALANQNNGEALYYHVSGIDDTPDMYYLEWRHSGLLPANWRLTADMEYVDRQRFFDEFGEVAEEYNRDKTVATIMLQKNWQKLSLVAHGRYIKDLEDEDNDTILQRLPELGLSLSRYRLGESPLYLSLESYATRFWREDGEDGERLYLKPSVAAVFKPGAWLDIIPAVALHGRLYEAEDNSESNSDFIPEFSLILATRLQKSFAFERWGAERLQHSIEPKVTYTYIPEEEQDDLPFFDDLDRFDKHNKVSYELINRLVARYVDEGGMRRYRDLLRLRLAQSYDIDEARNNTSGKDQPFSDVSVELDFWPTENISLDVESLIPVYNSTRFRTIKVGAAAMDDAGNAVKVNYNYKDEEFGDVATDYVSLRLDTTLLKPVYMRLEERYDFRESRELERSVGLEYRARCWSLLLTYRNRYQEDDDDDHEIMLNFILAGLDQNRGFGSNFGSINRR